MPEAVWFELRRQEQFHLGGVVECFGLGRRDVADGLQRPPMVEPVYPFEGGEFHGLERAPGAAPVNDFSLVETVDALGHGVDASML